MSDGRRGRGIAAAGGDARAPSSGFPRHIPHSSRRDAARGAHLEVIGPLQAAASGGAGRARVSQRRFHAQRIVPLPHGSSVERVGPRGEICEFARVCPPRTCHETGARRSDRRNGPRPNVSVRFESATARAHKHDRQTSALKTISLRYVPTLRSLTSASGCTPPRTSDASPAVPPATRGGEDLIHPQPRFHSRLPPL